MNGMDEQCEENIRWKKNAWSKEELLCLIEMNEKQL